jgi:hypothetical protein
MKVENLKIDKGRLDVNYLSNRVQDDRNFYSEINILQTALRNINVLNSIKPANDVTLPKYIFHADEYYKWECIQAKYYYVNIIEQIRACPTAEQYWINNAHNSANDIHEAYVCNIKIIKDKKLAETYFKILNNILPCNKNLYKWGKSERMSCYFCNVDDTISHLLFECVYAKNVWKIVKHVFFNNHEITQFKI